MPSYFFLFLPSCSMHFSNLRFTYFVKSQPSHISSFLATAVVFLALVHHFTRCLLRVFHSFLPSNFIVSNLHSPPHFLFSRLFFSPFFLLRPPPEKVELGKTWFTRTDGACASLSGSSSANQDITLAQSGCR